MRLSLLIAGVVALAACSSPDVPKGGAQGNDALGAASGNNDALRSPAVRTPRAIAGLPDNGRLVAYTTQTPVRHSAYTWHPVEISEAHALRAIATGQLTIDAPDGTPIHLEYDRHIEHPDGNWTWIGRPEGAKPGTEAIITFGEKAVFGSIPNRGGKPLRIGSSHGHAWVVETDQKRLAQMQKNGDLPEGPDFAVPPALAGARDLALSQAATQPQQLTASGAVPEAATVDVVVGYTHAFASNLGSTSAAVTRLTYLTDQTNVAFSNSETVARVRLVGTVALNYPDATDNQTALRELSGRTCTDLPEGGLTCEPAAVPAALLPLVALREAKNADLVSLVRNFYEPENGGCGIAWMLGGGLDEIRDSDVEIYGVSVVSDGFDGVYMCRDSTFAHEIGHNLGSQHDAETAMGGDGVLDDDDRGVFRYSMGFKSDASGFYTVMAYGENGMTGYLVFSNPRITYCGGHACGVAEEADNARSISQTAVLIARHARSLVNLRTRSDYNIDARSDLVWRNTKSGANSTWLSANSATPRTVTAVPNLAWAIAGSGDFNGDHATDLLWRNATTGQNQVWYSGLSTTTAALGATPSPWIVGGIGDFNGDGRDDILWRNPSTGANAIWRSANYATPQAMTAVNSAGWAIVGVGDFDGDFVDDVLWRNANSGVNSLWRSANSGTTLAITAVPNTAWKVTGVGDFDGDGHADVLWRHAGTGANVLWWSANSVNTRTLGATPAPWVVAGVADYNGDGDADIFWRNPSTYASVIWRSGNYATPTSVTSVANPDWVVRS